MRQLQALQIMMAGKSVFLTGAPGAGKTFILHKFIKTAKRAGRAVAVTASTGIAATHIGGTTIHSWSGLGIKDTISQWDLEKLKSSAKYVKRYNSTDVLVIDEVSMLHGKRLDMINTVAKVLRQNNEPFGGLQVVLVGDLFQLPPITRSGEATDFVQYSDAWTTLDPCICYITEQHRVSAGDTLLDLLSAMRQGAVNELHEQALRDRLGRQPDKDVVVTRLYAHNADVDSINQLHLQALTTDTVVNGMTSRGVQAKRDQLMKSVLAPEQLQLKRGAEVMFVANNFSEGYVNGTRGTVIDFVGDTPVVVTNDGREINVEPYSWKLEEDERVAAEVVQLPLRLAWAITIHKSQGMSLDAAEIDLSRTFTPGMGYVALSRVRSMDGLYLKGVNQMALTMHPAIFEFDETARQQSKMLADNTDDYVDQPVKEAAVLAEDTLLFDELRQWRLSRARLEGIAPYMVAHDSTLHEMAMRRPQTEQALLGIKGFGKTKMEKYGSEIIKIMS